MRTSRQKHKARARTQEKRSAKVHLSGAERGVMILRIKHRVLTSVPGPLPPRALLPEELVLALEIGTVNSPNAGFPGWSLIVRMTGSVEFTRFVEGDTEEL